MPRYKFTRDDVISAEEMEETLSRTPKLWLKALISFLYIFGPRIIEALRLEKRDFRVDGDKLIVRIGVVKRRQSGPFEDTPHILQVSLNTPFMEHVLAWLEQVEDPEELVWPLGRTWSTACWRAWMEIKKLNPKVSPHVFRHTRLTKLALRGATGPDLMDWAGWTDIRPAAKYLHAAGKLAEKFADKID